MWLETPKRFERPEQTTCYCCNQPIVYPALYYPVITGGYLCQACEEERKTLIVAAKLDEHLSAAYDLMDSEEEQTEQLQRFFGESVVGDPGLEDAVALAKETIAKADSIEAVERQLIERIEKAESRIRELERKVYDIRHAAQNPRIKGLGKKLTRVLELCN